jgi:uncharacterized protein (DUF1697 family)
MPKFIAFLRAINVGGHVVKMDELRKMFEQLDLAKVETFIASGNVIFETRSKDGEALQRKIAAHLRKSLGYEVGVFLRTDAEVAAVAKYEPFTASEIEAAGALIVAFLGEAPSAAAKQALMKHRSDDDNFHVHGREAYWLTRTRQSDSAFFKVGFDKALGMPTTARSITTVSKLAAKYPPA